MNNMISERELLDKLFIEKLKADLEVSRAFNHSLRSKNQLSSVSLEFIDDKFKYQKNEKPFTEINDLFNSLLMPMVEILTNSKEDIISPIPVVTGTIVKCECGGESANTTHSTWCNKHKL